MEHLQEHTDQRKVHKSFLNLTELYVVWFPEDKIEQIVLGPHEKLK